MDGFKKLSADEMNSLAQLAKSGDIHAKEELIDANYPLIKSVVKHFINKGVDYDDLYQIGSIGFLKAINNFDKSFNVKFTTYAVPMISGEIKRYLRDDGIIKVSRSLKTLSMKVKKYIDDYTKEHNESPSIENISGALNETEEDIVFALESSQSTLSIDAKIDESNSNSGLVVDKLGFIDKSENLIENIALKEAIKTLSDREKKILMLRYFRDKTQTEVAEILQVSQVQISRIEAKIIQTLKNILK